MDKSKFPPLQPHATTVNNQLWFSSPKMDKPKSPPPSTSHPHATAVDSSPSFFPPKVDKPKSPPPSTSHPTTSGHQMDKLKSILLKCATTPAKEPLNPSQRSFIEKRISEIFSDNSRTPDHPPYAWMIEKAIRDLNQKDGSSEDSISSFIVNEQKELPYAHSSILTHHIQKLSQIGSVVLNRYGCYSINKSRIPIRISDPKFKDTKRLTPFASSSIPSSSKELPHTKSSIPVISSKPSSSEEPDIKIPIPVFSSIPSSSKDPSYSFSESSYTSDENFRPHRQGRKLMKRKKRRNSKHNGRRGGARGRGLGRGYGRGLDPKPENMMLQVYNVVGGEGVESKVEKPRKISMEIEDNVRAPENETEDYINKFQHNEIRRERGLPIKRDMEMGSGSGIRRGRGSPRKRDMEMVVYGQNMERVEASGRQENVENVEMSRFPEIAIKEEVEEEGDKSRLVENFMMAERKRNMEMGEYVRAQENGIKRGRGRPRKVHTEIETAVIKRGRPRQIRMEECVSATGIKRGRGRPRKINIEMAEYENKMKLGEESEAFVVENMENTQLKEDFRNVVLKNKEISEVGAMEENVGGSQLREDFNNTTNMKGGEIELEHKQEIPDLDRELLQPKEEVEAEIIGQENPSPFWNAKAEASFK